MSQVERTSPSACLPRQERDENASQRNEGDVLVAGHLFLPLSS